MENLQQESTIGKMEMRLIASAWRWFLRIRMYDCSLEMRRIYSIVHRSLGTKADNALLSVRLINFPFSSSTRAILFVTHADAAFV